MKALRLRGVPPCYFWGIGFPVARSPGFSLVAIQLPITDQHNSQVMPVLASVSVLLLFILWGLAGLAFLLDRYRVPVLTFLVLLGAGVHFMTASKILPLPSDHAVVLAHPGAAETYLQLGNKCDAAQQACSDPPLITPDKIYREFEKTKLPLQTGQRPVIIVTATGGGIHAAAWTAEILARLEREFQNGVLREEMPPGAEFHKSILMMSTVSGGSVGTVPWAVEYLKTDRQFTPNSLEAMRNTAACSSLQAVAWGLTYADFLRVIYPYQHFFFGRDLDVYDRGWALQQALWRNRHYPKESSQD